MRSPTVRLAVGAATALALTSLLALRHQRRASPAAAPAPAAPTGITR
jgi:hypothetical protein